MSEEKAEEKLPPGRGWLAGGGVISGALALLGTSCCVLPLVLVNLGISRALVAHLAFFVRARDVFIALTLVLLAAGVVVALYGGRRPRRRFWLAVGTGFALVAAAWLMPHYERDLVQWVRP
jgi:mercuric ion transport protein